MLKLDASTTSVVVTCTACPHWSEMHWTREQALAAAADHARRCHDEPRGLSRNALDKARSRRRHAGEA